MFFFLVIISLFDMVLILLGEILSYYRVRNFTCTYFSVELYVSVFLFANDYRMLKKKRVIFYKPSSEFPYPKTG